jgi:hypothetical protein
MIKLDESELLNWIKTQEAFNQNVAQRLAALEKAPVAAVKYPYDLSQAKITYAFAGPNGKPLEEPASEALKNPKKGLTIGADGSFTFDNAGTATTVNSTAPRVEWRFYKNLTDKTNWKWNEHLIMPLYGVVFEKLSTANGVFFGQIHGITDAALLKLDAGKNDIRAIISRDDAGKDISTLSFGVKPVIGKEYAVTYYRKELLVEAFLYEYDRKSKKLGKLIGDISEKNVYRTDDMYTKVGAYSKDNVKITNFTV